MSKFIGRTEELEKLDKLLKKTSASLVVVMGRRRIGKSRLIQEFSKNHRLLNFAGLVPHPETSHESQLEDFGKQLGKELGQPSFIEKDWSVCFSRLASHTKKGRVIILLDEISWMGYKDSDFLGKLKNAWDLEFSKNPQLILVLCGSDSSWIKKHIINNTAFFGRRDLPLTIKELPLKDVNKFWNNVPTNSYEKFQIISITGGIPKYLEQIIPSDSAEATIKRLCFDSSGYLFNEFDSLFAEQFNKKDGFYKLIVEVLAEGPLSNDEICDALHKEKGGSFSSHLEELRTAGFLRREPIWSLKTGKDRQKNFHYRLSDNYLRFYLKYINPLKSQIEKGPVELPRGWKSIIALQFENMIINNRQELLDILKIKNGKVVNEGPYNRRGTKTQPGCQIDYLIQTKESFYVCEAKFSENVIGLEVVEEMKDKIKKLNIPDGRIPKPVLIHVNGVTKDLEEAYYFAEIIDFSKLLNPKER